MRDLTKGAYEKDLCMVAFSAEHAHRSVAEIAPCLLSEHIDRSRVQVRGPQGRPGLLQSGTQVAQEMRQPSGAPAEMERAEWPRHRPAQPYRGRYDLIEFLLGDHTLCDEVHTFTEKCCLKAIRNKAGDFLP
jgi:hypothetical protein